MARIRVARVEDIPPGQARVVEAEGRSLAVVNVDDGFGAGYLAGLINAAGTAGRD